MASFLASFLDLIQEFHSIQKQRRPCHHVTLSVDELAHTFLHGTKDERMRALGSKGKGSL
jgi:hypothetical protein